MQTEAVTAGILELKYANERRKNPGDGVLFAFGEIVSETFVLAFEYTSVL